MSKVSLTPIVNLQNQTTVVNAINANNSLITTAFDNTLSRDGQSPNQMLSTLDMNSHSIINLPAPGSLSEPITLGYLNTIVPGVVSGVSTISTYATRSLATAANVPLTTVVVQTAGYAAAGDGGGTFYTHASSLLLGGFQSADGQFWQPDYSNGINLRTLGAGAGNGTNDVAAMTAALNASTTEFPGTPVGYPILLTVGQQFDFSTGSFNITKHGTRILGQGKGSVIVFNPASPAVLFNFYIPADVGGINLCEVSNFEVYSTNAIQKTIICLQNSSFFLMDHINLQGISSTAGDSIGLLYKGRNLLTVKDCIINADNPVYFQTNPMKALVDGEDGDYLTFERNQLDCSNSTKSSYTVADGLNISNWVDRDSDWALGHLGVGCSDTSATPSAANFNWRFEGIRFEQGAGVGPIMFYIQRGTGNSILRNLSIINCAAGTGGLFSLSGIERVNIKNTTVFDNTALLGQADNTVARLKWENVYAGTGATVAIGTGLNLVRGREKMGGTNAAPIYTDAEYTNATDGLIEWLGPPSANGRRMGLYRTVSDVPVYSGANSYTLLPWTLYNVQYAEIKVTSPVASGIAIFSAGIAPPNGCTLLTGSTNFKVDASAGNLSVFHFSDVNVGIVNKLASPSPVTIEVLFTI